VSQSSEFCLHNPLVASQRVFIIIIIIVVVVVVIVVDSLSTQSGSFWMHPRTAIWRPHEMCVCVCVCVMAMIYG
jgi:hypothetical protein